MKNTIKWHYAQEFLTLDPGRLIFLGLSNCLRKHHQYFAKGTKRKMRQNIC